MSRRFGGSRWRLGFIGARNTADHLLEEWSRSDGLLPLKFAIAVDNATRWISLFSEGNAQPTSHAMAGYLSRLPDSQSASQQASQAAGDCNNLRWAELGGCCAAAVAAIMVDGGAIAAWNCRFSLSARLPSIVVFAGAKERAQFRVVFSPHPIALI